MEIKIVNMAGTIIRRVLLMANQQIDLQMQSIPQGEYLIQFVSPGGTVTQKIVIYR